MDLGLKGKKVIMNGGAHGLGLASLKLFAAEGADVAFMSRKEDKIEAATKEIDAAGPGKVHGSVVDMADGADNYKKWVSDAAAALVVSLLILLSLIPLFQGLRQSSSELWAIRAEERSEFMLDEIKQEEQKRRDNFWNGGRGGEQEWTD